MTKTGTVLVDIYDAWRTQNLDLLATYLPGDFCHTVYIPKEIHPLGGMCQGKVAAVDRLRLIASEFDFLRFDTSDLIIHDNRAGAEIPIHYRHRETGVQLETVIANFWTFEDGWPIRLVEYHDLIRIQAFTNNLAALTPSAGARVP
jgi:hypothetical protein